MWLHTVIGAAAATPILMFAGLLTYMQTAVGYDIKPEYVVAGITLIFLLSVYILRREAQRVFSLIDTVPQVSHDVSIIKDDISEIRDTVRGLLPWKEDVSQRLGIIEWRLGEQEDRRHS